MNIKRLKIVTALLLIAANICFAVLLAVNFRNKNYYDSETIENAYKAMESGGMSVSRGILERKQQSFCVYTGARGISSCEDILLLYGTLAEHYNVGDDVSVVSEQGKFNFYRDGSFSYETSGEKITPENGAEYSDVTAKEKVKKEIKNTICEFLKIDELEECESNRKSNVNVDLSVDSIYYEPKTETYTVKAYQTFDGERISSGGIKFIVYEKKVMSASGTFSFVYPTEKLSADCLDALNIIFLEKTYFGDDVQEGLLLSEITYFYSVYDSADGKRYFIPMCHVFYNKNDIWGVYNLISGKRE